MSWTTSVAELRALLSDGDTDKYSFRKRCFGETNGANKLFKTLEIRRITDFTATAGVFKNGVALLTSAVSSDSTAKGEFTLGTAPVDGDVIEASYYVQWFIDTELGYFLTNAARWLSSSEDITTVEAGLKPAALKYAAADAYQKLADRLRTSVSETFKVEDSPSDKAMSPVESAIKMAKMYRDDALKSRDEFYTRQGRKLQPLFSAVRGNVRNLP